MNKPNNPSRSQTRALVAEQAEYASHWIRPCPNAAACPKEIDQGWRLHVSFEDDEGYLEVVEEQVLPEKVARADANHIRATNGHIRLNPDECKWLIDTLTALLPTLDARYHGREEP
jgi:hypothetical protein